MIAIRIRTTNDRNGNPRRGWIVVDDEGETIAFVDEGCAGIGALESWKHDHTCLRKDQPIPVSYELDVTPGEYRAQVRAQKARRT